MPEIILSRGRAGTGKSTLSNELGRVLSMPVLHKDDIYDSVALPLLIVGRFRLLHGQLYPRQTVSAYKKSPPYFRPSMEASGDILAARLNGLVKGYTKEIILGQI